MYSIPTYSKNQKVLVFDLDHTIIGDCTILSKIDFIVKSMKWIPDRKPVEITVQELMSHLQNGLLRPGFIDYIHRVREIYGSLVVVYTASLDYWAKKILKAINHLVGYQFYCLLLTREFCIPPNYDKSLDIVKSELKKMGIHRNDEDFIMIDNNQVMVDKRLILATGYHWAPYISILRRINPLGLISPYDRNRAIQLEIEYFQGQPFKNNHIHILDTYFKKLSLDIY